MKLSGSQLEQIVTEVMVELFRPAVERSRETVAPAPAVKPSVSAVTTATVTASVTPEPVAVAPVETVLALSERVITGALLEEKGRGVKRLAVLPGAVLTPSARDFVRKHGIDVTKDAATTTAAAPREAVRWRLLVSKAGPGVMAAAEAWVAECGWRKKELVGAAREAAAKAVSLVATAEVAGVIVLTDRVDEVTVLSNRNDKVRAVAATSVRGLQASIELVGPNLFVIDPGQRGLFEIRQMLKAIVAGGKPKDRLAAEVKSQK